MRLPQVPSRLLEEAMPEVMAPVPMGDGGGAAMGHATWEYPGGTWGLGGIELGKYGCDVRDK